MHILMDDMHAVGMEDMMQQKSLAFWITVPVSVMASSSHTLRSRFSSFSSLFLK